MGGGDPVPGAMHEAGMDILLKFLNIVHLVDIPPGSETLIEGISHSPKVDAGLIAILREGVNGFDVKDIKEVGGALKETDFYSVDIDINPRFKNQYRINSVTYREKTYPIDVIG